MAIVKCSCGLALQQFDYASHVNGKRHSKALAGGKPRRVRKPFPIREDAAPRQSHSGAQAKVKRSPLAEGVFPVIEEAELSPTSNSSSTRCPHCRKDIAHWQFREHLVAHDLQERLDSALQEAQRNKRGITVDGLTAVDFGIVSESETPVVILNISRESELSPPPSVFLAEFRLLSSNRNDEYGDR